MQKRNRESILTMLRDKLVAYLEQNHPFLDSQEGDGSFEFALRSALQQSQKFITTDPTISGLVGQMLEVIGLDVPIGVAVEYAAYRVAITGEIPKDDPISIGMFYDYVVRPVVVAQQEMVFAIAEFHPDLSPQDRNIMDVGTRIAWLFDEIFSKWWQYVVIPYQTGIAQDPSLKEAFKSGPFQNKYAILVDERGLPIAEPLTQEMLGRCREIPFAEAFPLEVHTVLDEIGDLERRLPSGSTWQGYLHALSDALTNTDLGKMEELWAEVDIRWVEDIGPEKLVPAHMMEDGYHHPIQISPEWRIMLRTGQFAREIASVRTGVAAFGKEIGDDEALTKLAKVDAAVFITAIAGGCGIDFRFAGQSVPNRPEAQMSGMKVFLDGEAMEQRHHRFENVVRACADEETCAWVLPLLNLRFHVSSVVSHEFAHPLQIIKKLIDAFGANKSGIEEGKATLEGIFGQEKGMSTEPNFYPQLSAYLLGEILRRFDKRAAQDPTLRPYLNEAMMIVTSLTRHGIISCVGGKIHMDRNSPIMVALHGPTSRLVDAYREVDLGDAMQVIADFAPGIEEDEDISTFYRVVNANLHPEELTSGCDQDA